MRIAVLLLALCCACGTGELLGSATPDPVTVDTSGWPDPPADATDATVARVVDGDTLVLDGIDVGETDRRTGGRRARLIGVDTPEVHQGVECYGREASGFAERVVEGRTVEVVYDVERTDRYGRALVYVWSEGVMFNARLVAEGYAQQLTIPPNVRYAELFTTLVREARAEGRGLWGEAC